MRKMFQYRIYPTKKHMKALEATLEECRWLYNHVLEKRRDAWKQEEQSLSLYQQQETLSIFAQLAAKAEEAGRELIKVNSAYTSQTYSRCGHQQKMPLSERTYHCPC